MNKKTQRLQFYTQGPEFTNLLLDLLRSGEISKVVKILLEGGLSDDAIRSFLLGTAHFEGDSRDPEGLKYRIGEANEKISIELLYTCFGTLLSDRDDTLRSLLGTNRYEDGKVKEELDLFRKIVPQTLITSIVREPLFKQELKTLGYNFVKEGEDFAHGVVLLDGRVIEVEYMGHRELYTILYRFGFTTSSDWVDDYWAIHVTGNECSAGCTSALGDNGLTRLVDDYSEVGDWDITSAQLKTLFNRPDKLKVGGFYSAPTRNQVRKFVCDHFDHGTKFGNLEYIKWFLPGLASSVPKISKDLIEGLDLSRQCIRTSPDKSIPGLLNSKFDLSNIPKVIKELEADWELYKDVHERNAFHYFYQEFIPGCNGVASWDKRIGLRYELTENQGDIVQGKEGKVRLGSVKKAELEDICTKLGEHLADFEIQVEFVVDVNDKLWIVQFRVFEETPDVYLRWVPDGIPIITAKSYSRGQFTGTADEILVVEQDADSSALIGKKALIVKKGHEFSHILALSRSLKIPSVYSTDYVPSADKEITIDAYSLEGKIYEKDLK